MTRFQNDEVRSVFNRHESAPKSKTYSFADVGEHLKQLGDSNTKLDNWVFIGMTPGVRDEKCEHHNMLVGGVVSIDGNPGIINFLLDAINQLLDSMPAMKIEDIDKVSAKDGVALGIAGLKLQALEKKLAEKLDLKNIDKVIPDLFKDTMSKKGADSSEFKKSGKFDD